MKIKDVRRILGHPHWKWAVVSDLVDIVASMGRLITLQLYQCRWQDTAKKWIVEHVLIQDLKREFPDAMILKMPVGAGYVGELSCKNTPTTTEPKGNKDYVN